MTQHIIPSEAVEKLTPEKWFNRKLAETRQSNDKDLHSALVKNAGFYSYGYEQAIIDLRALIANSPQADGKYIFYIEVEKMLLDVLGREWKPSGFSIETLLAEIKEKLSAYKPQADDVIRNHERYLFLRNKCSAADEGFNGNIATEIIHLALVRPDDCGEYPSCIDVSVDQAMGDLSAYKPQADEKEKL